MQTIAKRMTGKMDGDFVVFLIGMRVNRWWRVLQWFRVALAMPPMVKELEGNPELGFLGAETWFGRTTLMLSYWRSMDDLMAYAKNRDAKHMPAWRAFNKFVGTNGDVGIWHETYRVRPGDYENVYVNMMPFGLGRAGELVEASGKRESAAGRLASASPEGRLEQHA
jgi:GH15 family glucan-1,4-alpha-glucosidase